MLGTDSASTLLSPPDDPITFNNFTPHSVSIGDRHICAVGESPVNGRVRCWGNCKYGRCGYGHTETIGTTNANGSMARSVDLDLGPDFVAIKVMAAADHSCALSMKSEVRCWGQNSKGQCGVGHWDNIGDEDGEMGNNLTSVDFGTGFIPIDVAVGHDFGCALSESNS